MKDTMKWDIGKRELNQFMLIISSIYFVFIVISSIMLSLFGSLRGFGSVSTLFGLEILASLMFMIRFKRMEKTRENYYHLMVFMTLFSAVLFMAVTMTVA